jgi:hypothetical protein
VCVGFFELLSSCQVPKVFSLSSQRGPIKFPNFPICSPNMFPIAHDFVPYALPNVVFLEPILVGKETHCKTNSEPGMHPSNI